MTTSEWPDWIPDKDFDDEYRTKGAYHATATGFRRWFLERNYRLLQRAGAAGARILDLGCGEGELGRYFRATQRVVGVDRALAGLSLAPRSDTRHYVQASISDLPFRTGSFDAVVSSLALQYLPPEHWPRLLAELERILLPEGVLSFSYINAATRRGSARPNRAPTASTRILTLGALRALLTAQRWIIVSCVGTNLPVNADSYSPVVRQLVWTVAAALGARLPSHSYHFVVSARVGRAQRIS